MNLATGLKGFFTALFDLGSQARVVREGGRLLTDPMRTETLRRKGKLVEFRRQINEFETIIDSKQKLVVEFTESLTREMERHPEKFDSDIVEPLTDAVNARRVELGVDPNATATTIRLVLEELGITPHLRTASREACASILASYLNLARGLEEKKKNP